MESYFGKNCRYLRRIHGLSQIKVRGMLLIPRTTFSNYENSTTHPPPAIAALVASFFQVTLHAMLLTDLEAEQIESAYYHFLAGNQIFVVAGNQVATMILIVGQLLIDVAIIEDSLQNRR